MQYSEEALQTVRETRLLIDQYDSWIMEQVQPFLGKRIIEVGCGVGNLLNHFINKELIVGIDNSDEAVEEVKRKFSEHNNVHAFEFSITDPSVLSLKRFNFDSAISLNVLEHIEDDEKAINHITLLLQPNSHLVLIVPAHQWIYGTMDRSIGHYRRYTKSVIKTMLEKKGYEIVHQKYMNMFGALGWLINGRLLRKEVPPTGQLKVFNKIVPAIKIVENKLPVPFGISLVTIAKLMEVRKLEMNFCSPTV